MIIVHKKIVVDEKGKPTEVIIPWEEYKEIEELLGLDLDENALDDLEQAREDRKDKRDGAYVELDSL
jgi:PHD/YefM family antitoxin component YafN of YafNO toxin-antitoxin module